MYVCVSPSPYIYYTRFPPGNLRQSPCHPSSREPSAEPIPHPTTARTAEIELLKASVDLQRIRQQLGAGGRKLGLCVTTNTHDQQACAALSGASRMTQWRNDRDDANHMCVCVCVCVWGGGASGVVSVSLHVNLVSQTPLRESPRDSSVPIPPQFA